jgi:hypothetical protein
VSHLWIPHSNNPHWIWFFRWRFLLSIQISCGFWAATFVQLWRMCSSFLFVDKTLGSPCLLHPLRPPNPVLLPKDFGIYGIWLWSRWPWATSLSFKILHNNTLFVHMGLIHFYRNIWISITLYEAFKICWQSWFGVGGQQPFPSQTLRPIILISYILFLVEAPRNQVVHIF